MSDRFWPQALAIARETGDQASEGLWLGNLLLFDGGVTVKNRILAVKEVKNKNRQNHQKKQNAELVKNFAPTGRFRICILSSERI